MRETRLGNGPPTEPGRTARLCSRLSGPQGKGTARRGTEASGLGGTKTRTQNFSPPRAGPDHSRPPSPRLKTETRRPAVHGPQGDTRGAHGGPARGRGLRASSGPTARGAGPGLGPGAQGRLAARGRVGLLGPQPQRRPLSGRTLSLRFCRCFLKARLGKNAKSHHLTGDLAISPLSSN